MCTDIIISKSIARGLRECTTINTYTSETGRRSWEERGTLISCSAYTTVLYASFIKKIYLCTT